MSSGVEKCKNPSFYIVFLPTSSPSKYEYVPSKADSISDPLSLLDQSSLNDESNDITASLPSLVRGLQICKQSLSDQTVDEEIRKQLWDFVMKVGKKCADSAKDGSDSVRDSIGSSEVIEITIQMLNLNSAKECPPADIQCLRTIANLCIDHTQNRQRTLDLGGVQAILSKLKQTEDVDVIRTACGALLNAGLDFDPINAEIIKLDGISSLTQLLEPENMLNKNIDEIDSARTAVHYATRVVLSVVGTDEGKLKSINNESLAALVHLLVYSSLGQTTEDCVDILENVIEVLEILALENEDSQRIIVSGGLFASLLDYLEFSKPPTEDRQQSKRYGQWKAVVLKVVVSTTMNDKNMEPLFENEAILNRFLQWLSLGPTRDDLQMCAALSLGNLARTDAHCIKLVHEFKVVEPLVDAIKKSEKNIKVQHATVGILKNLVLPVSNKSIIGSLGVIELVSPFLDQDSIQPIQIGVVGILKHLAFKNALNSKRIILGENPSETETQTPLSRLLTLIKQTDDISIRSEGTRVLVNLIKVVWGHSKIDAIDGTTVNILRSKLDVPEAVQPIANMVIESKYPVLQNEGIIGLTLLMLNDSSDSNPTMDILTSKTLPPKSDDADDNAASSSSELVDSSSPSPSPSPLLNALLAILINDHDRDQDGYPDEIRSNVCLLLDKAVKASSGEHKLYLRNHVPNSLTPLLDPTWSKPVSDNIKRDIEKILRSLD